MNNDALAHPLRPAAALLVTWLVYSAVALYWFHLRNPVFPGICRAVS